MKNVILSLALFVGFTTANAQTKEAPNTENTAKSTIDFVSKVVDYGTIEHNSDGVRKFVFTNNGTEDLIIKNAKGSCGCTVPQWPKEPIAPGATGEINVKFSSKGKKGSQNKTVTLTANTTPPNTKLRVTGQIEVIEQ